GSADDELLDVARAFVDLGHAHVPPQALDREIGDVAVAAVDLDRIRAHALGHLGGKKLGHRRLLDAGRARVAQPRRVQVELARGLDAGRHVGEPEVDRLVLDQRLAHAAALARIGKRSRQRRSRDAGRLRGDVDAARLEIGERDAVAGAFLAQKMFRFAVFQDDLRGIRCALAGLLLDSGDDVAGRLGWDQEGADSLLPGTFVRYCKYNRDIRVLARGDELLHSVQDVVRPLALGARGDRARIGA